MTSLVSEFLINPVLRQARRLSDISRATSAGDTDIVPGQDARSTESGRPPSQIVDDSAVESSDVRPTSSSTQATRVETSTTDTEVMEVTEWNYPAMRTRSPAEPAASTVPAPVDPAPVDPAPVDPAPVDPAPVVTAPVTGGQLPEDDGMGVLRGRILAIQSQDILSCEKARLMHETLMEGYRKSRRELRTRPTSKPNPPAVPTGEAWEQSLALRPLEALKFWQNSVGESSATEKLVLTAEDIKSTYAPVDDDTPPGTLGCQHYRRNVKLQCSTCDKWYTCRFCHDHTETHALIRKETKNMLCMLCGCPQRASDVCVKCGETAARYYCNICKLWDDKPTKSIYHCADCGICRRGRGIGKDVFHCKTCCACIPINNMDSHRCVERSTDSNCPICGDYMFTSPKPLCFLPCGHSIHQKCFEAHGRTSYKCPICNKSFQNMESLFRSLDVAIQSQPMPPEFRGTKAVVLCNDCCARSTTKYHWLGVKCAICHSYNTANLQILGNTALSASNVSARQAGAQGPAPPASVETVVPAAVPASAPAPPPSERSQRAIATRRRHSSHGQELHYEIDARLARSLSPEYTAQPPAHLANRTAEDDSDDEHDILRFWARDSGDDDDKQDEDESEDDEDEDDNSDGWPDGDEDDEDSDDEIVLIGHR